MEAWNSAVAANQQGLDCDPLPAGGHTSSANDVSAEHGINLYDIGVEHDHYGRCTFYCPYEFYDEEDHHDEGEHCVCPHCAHCPDEDDFEEELEKIIRLVVIIVSAVIGLCCAGCGIFCYFSKKKQTQAVIVQQ